MSDAHDSVMGQRRPRRLRRTAALRGLIRETHVCRSHLVQPLFLVDGSGVESPIPSLPGISLRSIDVAVDYVLRGLDIGVQAFALFPKIDEAKKSPDASEGLDDGNLLCRAVRALRKSAPESCLITDVALDPYSSDGHDGLVRDGVVLNDESVAVLARMAVLHARAGADIVAPSDMMDGRVLAIRTALDQAGCTDTAIMSYAAKYASAFYGPFRDALDSAPASRAGIPAHKQTYQLDPANGREAMTEAALDEAEGADILLVKPATPYLDVITRLRERTDLPIAAYQVSGEYAAIMAAGERGWIDADACLQEAVTGIVRAGADVVLSYAAMDLAHRGARLQ